MIITTAEAFMKELLLSAVVVVVGGPVVVELVGPMVVVVDDPVFVVVDGPVVVEVDGPVVVVVVEPLVVVRVVVVVVDGVVLVLVVLVSFCPLMATITRVRISTDFMVGLLDLLFSRGTKYDCCLI